MLRVVSGSGSCLCLMTQTYPAKIGGPSKMFSKAGDIMLSIVYVDVEGV